MRKAHEWMKHLSLKKKIILYSYFVVTPVLLIISIILFLNNYKKMIEKQHEENLNSVRSLGNSLDVIETEVTDLSLYICINNDITKILTTENPLELNKDSRLWLNRAPMKIIQDMIALKGYIKTIAIYPENGVRPYLRCIDATSYLPSIEEVRNTDIYQKSLKGKGAVYWRRVSRTDKSTYQANRTDKIVMYRGMYDLAKKTPLGYLVIGIAAEKYTDLCVNAVQQQNEGIVVFSAEGTELTRYGKVAEEIVRHIQSENYIQKGYKKRESQFALGDYNVFCSQHKENGVLVCKMVPKSNEKGPMYTITSAPITLLIAVLIGLFPVLMFISAIVSKPLDRLCRAMEQFKLGDFNQQVEVTAYDEVGEVTECFNQMVVEIKELINNNYVMALAEKESELRALQAQINPHFLYNTLDSLYWRALDAGNEEISEDILALSQLFRMVLSEGKGVTTVAQEKELLTRYLHIQKMRFTKRLDYKIMIEEEILEAMIPKLILQPFVENAIVHGFENVGTECLLLVTGCLSDNQILFCIKDNGAGMTKEQIEAIWNVEDLKRYANQRVGRYAIKNVKERLALKYQDNFLLTIDSEIGKGTTVTIRIPFEKKEI